MPLAHTECVRWRDELLALIRAAFDDVELEDGVSVSQAYAIDNYEDTDTQRRARATDTYTHWTEVDIPGTDSGGSALSFMDQKGFRFHIPAYMTFTLRHRHQEFGGFIDSNAHATTEFTLSGYDNPQGPNWSLLTPQQLSCCAAFLAFQAATAGIILEDNPIEYLEKYWHTHLRDVDRKRLAKAGIVINTKKHPHR